MQFVISSYFAPRFNRKILARHSLEASKCASGRGSTDRSPYRRSSIPTIPPTQRISDFLPSKRGAHLVKSFDVSPSLVRGLKWESAHEVLEFDFVGIPAFPSRYANFHQFLKLTIAFSFPCSENSSLGCM
ncbi:hypothetical protein AVEN_184759-1 [Araneus ventricosus]|uniref:Uncharacterized protein n=1 Tax=Araneus ventricosus TaxID=182803 RepID=A0A4Y2KXQ2_ARAVE|nr:hypothetical protein AVEN_184759-1 [Araneus ventricosus]